MLLLIKPGDGSFVKCMKCKSEMKETTTTFNSRWGTVSKMETAQQQSDLAGKIVRRIFSMI